MKYKRLEIAIIVFILFLLPALNVYAQETKTLTLNEAVELSLKNSKQLQFKQSKNC
jgi:hypothetical protein